jgi:hypothetical protein
MEEVKTRGAAVIRADVLARAHGLAERSAAVLVAVHEAGELALADLEPQFSEVSRRSLQRDLRLLLDKELIREAQGSGGATDPNRAYRPVQSPPAPRGKL